MAGWPVFQLTRYCWPVGSSWDGPGLIVGAPEQPMGWPSTSTSSSQITTTGLRLGLNTPENAAWLTNGGRKQKCGFPPATRQSENAADGGWSLGEVSERSSRQATTAPRATRQRGIRFMIRSLEWRPGRRQLERGRDRNRPEQAQDLRRMTRR